MLRHADEVETEELGYRFLRRIALRNPRILLTAIITNNAQFLVTFDDWCSQGTTENAVVVYDLERGTARAHALEEFLPAPHREALGRSISNVSWRGEPHTIGSKQMMIYVPVPSGSATSEASLLIDPATNTISFQSRRNDRPD